MYTFVVLEILKVKTTLGALHRGMTLMPKTLSKLSGLNSLNSNCLLEVFTEEIENINQTWKRMNLIN